MTHAYDNVGGPGTTDEGDTLSTAGEDNVHIQVLPLDPCDFDWGEDWIESTDGTIYWGSQGADILVASAAFTILALVTNKRMTP